MVPRVEINVASFITRPFITLLVTLIKLKLLDDLVKNQRSLGLLNQNDSKMCNGFLKEL